MTYGSEPMNPTSVLEAVRDPRLRGYLVDKSVPWDAVDLPLVDALPKTPKDRMEVNLVVGSGVTRMLYRASTATWTQIGAAPLVTTLPTTTTGAVDGMLVSYVADDTNGVEWLLRFDSSETTYKWHFVGGPSLFNEVLTVGTRTNTTYAAADTGGAGPTVTCPLAGDYDVTIGASMYQTTGGAGYYSYKIGATGAVDADSIAQSSTLTAINGMRTRRKTLTDAGTILLAQYKATANTLNMQDRFMAAVPVRVI